MDFTPEGRRIHMLGIAGSGMSSLAQHLCGRGARVSGTDAAGGPILTELGRLGVRILPSGREADLPEDTEILVHSAAVTGANPVVAEAMRRGVETLKYAHMLGRVMAPYTGIAVAGTHGKTTVSALCAWLLREAGLSPSFVLGGHVPDLQGGGGCGQGVHFVAEACEYDRSFLSLRPLWAVVTNIEPDHLDYFGDFDSLLGAFDAFIRSVAERAGRLVLSQEAAERIDPARYAGLQAWTYGFSPGADLRISEVSILGGRPRFGAVLHGEDLGRFEACGPGAHNILNTAAAALVALELGVPAEAIRDALPRFRGVKRRLEDKGTFDGVRLLSDYAHHPTEVQAGRDALRAAFPQARIVAAFQGHQRWRTEFFLKDFGRVLAGFDRALVLETFSVRESAGAGHPECDRLVEEIARSGGESFYVGGLKEAPAAIVPHVEAGDVLVLMGAGSIDEIAGEIARELSLRHESAL